MKKKLLSLVCALALTITLLPAAQALEGEGTRPHCSCVCSARRKPQRPTAAAAAGWVFLPGRGAQ